jgi:hypothetical protein
MWVLSLEELSTFPLTPKLTISNPYIRTYPFLSDNPNPQNFGEANFKLVWDAIWHPNMVAMFSKGMYWDAFDFPHSAFVTNSCFDFQKNKWYLLTLTWDHTKDNYKLFVNGVLTGEEDKFYPDKFRRDKTGDTLYFGNPALCFSDIKFYDCVLTNEEIQTQFTNEVTVLGQDLQAELRHIYTGENRKPFDWTPDKEWKLNFQTDFQDPSDLERFYVQGKPERVEVIKDGLLIETVDTIYNRKTLGKQMYLWTDRPFEGDLYVEFEFNSLRPGGLSLLMTNASGMNREDFMADYPLRTSGRMDMVHKEDVRNYHWEYYREMSDVRNDVANGAIMKNPFNAPIAFGCFDRPLEKNKWHKVQYLQIGNKIIGAIDGVIIVEGTDNGFSNNGPVYDFGRVAIRCMLHSKIMFRNLKIYNREKIETVGWIDPERQPLSQSYSQLIYPDKEGKLSYKPYTEKGDKLPDFSFCGYKRGGMAIPTAVVKRTVFPGDFSKDDSKRIQQAIDKLGREEPDANGIRGAILLKKGRYNIQHTITITYSGIVLRGEGDDENGTVLVGTQPKQYELIKVGTEGQLQKIEQSVQPITDQYVPSGSRKITVENASAFKVGDEIIVERPSTSEWISYIGMDQIAPQWARASGLNKKEKKKAGKAGLLSPDGEKYNITVQWAPGSKNLLFERTITAVNGNEITLDIPLANAFQQEFGGGLVYRYELKNRIQQVGIEDLRGESVFDKSVVKNDPYIGEYYADEDHTSVFVLFHNCEHVWARNLTSRYITNGFTLRTWCRFATVQDCSALDPVATISGGRRYAYGISGGQMCLVQRCRSSYMRHDFVLGMSVPGPNAFVDSKTQMTLNSTEPHQRWAAGCLFDNCSLSGPVSYITAVNRGNYGTGHGWAGAQMLFWNCKCPVSVIMQPPTAQNFSIGGFGNVAEKWSTPEELQKRIDKMNIVSGANYKYEGIPVVGNGYFESPMEYVTPQFLYYQQLLDRLGKNAVMQVTTDEQQKVIFGTSNHE